MYDFTCTLCNCRFTLMCDSAEEITDTVCLECRAPFEKLRVFGPIANDEAIARLLKEFSTRGLLAN